MSLLQNLGYNRAVILEGNEPIVTTTPRMECRSFGTNVIEAMCRCLVDKPADQISADDFLDLIQRVPIKPQVHSLNCLKKRR